MIYVTYDISVSVSVYLVLSRDIKITADYRSLYKLGAKYTYFPNLKWSTRHSIKVQYSQALADPNFYFLLLPSSGFCYQLVQLCLVDFRIYFVVFDHVVLQIVFGIEIFSTLHTRKAVLDSVFIFYMFL